MNVPGLDAERHLVILKRRFVGDDAMDRG